MIRHIVWIVGLSLLPLGHLTATQSPTPPLQPEWSLAEKNAQLGKRFLEENKKKPGIHALASGLQYKILKEGHGNSPGPTDFVTVHYRGTLLDGKEFDSSYSRNAPTTLAVNAVIPGWVEALQLMKPEAKWTLYIPPQLAYGEQGAGRLIAPNATLIFDIELISVKSTLDETQDGFGEELGDE